MSIGMCFGSSKYDSDSTGDFFTIMEQSNRIKRLGQSIQQYEEKEITIKKLTGLDLDDLIRLFAAGYTLTQPVYPNLADVFKAGGK